MKGTVCKFQKHLVRNHIAKHVDVSSDFAKMSFLQTNSHYTLNLRVSSLIINNLPDKVEDSIFIFKTSLEKDIKRSLDNNAGKNTTVL